VTILLIFQTIILLVHKISITNLRIGGACEHLSGNSLAIFYSECGVLVEKVFVSVGYYVLDIF
jgi:hypothetical protein